MVANPGDPGLLGLKNLSASRWQGQLSDGRTIALEPGKTCNLAALQQLHSCAGAIHLVRS